MKNQRVKLSPQGQDYLRNPNCSTIVRTILSSIDIHSAEVLHIEESIIRVRLEEDTLPEEFDNFNNFAIHKDHVVIC